MTAARGANHCVAQTGYMLGCPKDAANGPTRYIFSYDSIMRLINALAQVDIGNNSVQ